MLDLDKDFLDLIFSYENPFDWDKKNYRFSRDEKDMHPYSVYTEKDNTIITHNILGIDKKDLKIKRVKENGKYYLLLDGTTVDPITKKKYSISSRFMLDDTQLDLTSMTAKVDRGLLYITIKNKKEKMNKISENIDII